MSKVSRIPPWRGLGSAESPGTPRWPGICYACAMTRSELAHLELLAEIDSLSQSLSRWAESAPAWREAEICSAIVRRLFERTAGVRVRLEAPLVVAILGGTGTGKSALVNAIVGRRLVASGRQRPTTERPALVCRAPLMPEMLGIDPAAVDLVHEDAAALADLVLVDCPDPDTSESDGDATNLARLRRILPHCDVLLLTATQQKYRSARVAEELAAAAPGARLVFVQTHGDTDEDIRDDWRRVLGADYEPGHIFKVDSLAALENAERGLSPRGEFRKLMDLLTGQLAGAAATRIRRANFLDLVDDTLDLCGARLSAALPAIDRLAAAIDQERQRLGVDLAGRVEAELLSARRIWETRLVGRVASRWGISPFSVVLRVYQGLGGLVSSALLFRVRTPAQLALWGVFEGARSWQKARGRRRADQGAQQALSQCWSEDALRQSSLVLDGYAIDAGVQRERKDTAGLVAEAVAAGERFAEEATGELDALVQRVADRHAGWLARAGYELLFSAMLVFVLMRPAKNYFYDSWLASAPADVLGLDFYLVSAFWLVLWSILLLWRFTIGLRRGLKREIGRLVDQWRSVKPAAGLFAGIDAECRRAQQFGDDLARLKKEVTQLRQRLDLPDLGRRR